MAAGRADGPITPIGGFFELHRPGSDATGPSVLETWTGGRPFAAYANARSAFAALAALLPEATIWLPAFLCVDLMGSAFRDRLRFYPVRDGFEPDLTVVEAEATTADLVLLVAQFGLPIGDSARDFARRRRDLWIVEDRAQALGPGLGPCAGYALYSPRKLLGVADGGILVAPEGRAPLPQPAAVADEDKLWRPALLRHADPHGADNARWYAASRTKEAAMRAGPEAITARSLSILSETPIAGLAAARWANWRFLDARLRRWSALPPDPQAPPLGYVLRLAARARDHLLAALHAERIFAAVHWPTIAAAEADFPREAGWTRELVTLPCDHRYGEAEMVRIAERVVEVLA
ncbi:MAG: hypothetical protein EPO51_08595 [Phenylobacterium sp.]|uniref:hypothetical protein n=1 Tax=Phenylobacterium sp. TaxID=1871053 RepID=UPI00122777E3|nr:hypothetical protein [Phenylobacterium sp.]TAJ72165.1 MAG: hypothetical protein EPO51_08595 [Phenylobacterium sp.]